MKKHSNTQTAPSCLQMCSPPSDRWPSELSLRPATRPWTSRGSSPSPAHWTAASCTAVQEGEERRVKPFKQPMGGASQRCRHLLVGHELDGRLGGDFQHVDPVPSPQGRGAALLQHLLEAADQADLVALGRVHLNRDYYMIQHRCFGWWYDAQLSLICCDFYDLKFRYIYIFCLTTEKSPNILNVVLTTNRLGTAICWTLVAYFTFRSISTHYKNTKLLWKSINI